MKLRKVFSALLIATANALAGLHESRAANYEMVTNEHVDLQITLSGGIWRSLIRADSGDVPRHQGLLYEDFAEFISPGGAEWEFLGVDEGDPIYIFPQLLDDPDRIALGWASDDGSIPAGTLASYFETDSRVGKSATWIKITLVGMRFVADPTDSATNAPQFSLWQTGGALGGPSDGTSVWMATADGIGGTDATWLLADGHSHYNWGFSRKGYYQLDFKYSGYLNNGQMTFTESPVFTFHFGVEHLPLTIPEPSTALLVFIGIGGLLVRRPTKKADAF